MIDVDQHSPKTTYHDDSLKSQWKKKNSMKINAARKWVCLKNS